MVFTGVCSSMHCAAHRGILSNSDNRSWFRTWLAPADWYGRQKIGSVQTRHPPQYVHYAVVRGGCGCISNIIGNLLKQRCCSAPDSPCAGALRCSSNHLARVSALHPGRPLTEPPEASSRTCPAGHWQPTVQRHRRRSIGPWRSPCVAPPECSTSSGTP